MALLAALRAGPGPELAALRAFAARVDWREPWLAALLAGQATLLAAVVRWRACQPFQLTVLAASFALVRSGAAINAAARTHWRSFASRCYFDEGGAFFGAVVAAPLLLTMGAQVALQLATAWRLMVGIEVARARARRARKEKVR
jgi:hypothetical protein